MKFLIFMRLVTVISFCVQTTAVFARELNLLENPGFEKKSAGAWLVFDSSRFELSEQVYHSGKRALVFHPLKDGAGVSKDVSLIVKPGSRYSFSGWFRNLEASWGQIDVLVLFRQQGNERQLVIGRADCNKTDWTNVNNEFFIPEDADQTGLRLVTKTAWGQIAFVVDDLEIRPALQIIFTRPSPDGDPDLLFHLGDQNPARADLKAKIEIFDYHNQTPLKFTQSLYVPIHQSLAPGFYRVVATVADLDKREFKAERACYFGALETLAGNLDEQIRTIFATQNLARYHGWLRYLQYRVKDYQRQEGKTGDNTLQSFFRLNRWTQEIRINPQILDTLSGVQEWAYLSRVDDSGQPFKIAIPAGYDAKKSYPLVVVLHGYGGNHMEYSGGVRSNPDYFELHVLGRARGGGYVDLSEADVLAAVEYVQETWSIDKRRIHLTGTSMGGGGTFRLISRYPDRWASGRPVCGYGSDLQIRNGLQVPIYSTHSQDDPTVPVLGSRAPLQKLMRAGGQVIIDETNGLQHAAWNYSAGNNRALQWMRDQVLPENRDVRQVEYTAIDRQTCSAYWLKIAEWGNHPGPAYFKATMLQENQLYLHLENIRRLQLKLADSPVNQKKDLCLSVNGNVSFKVTAPLADSILLADVNGTWSAGGDRFDQPERVLHTPGGIHNIYCDEPLLIVYGTRGDQKARQAMSEAAIAASKSPNPLWVGDQGDIKEGVPNHQLLYGRLIIKPDTAVTPTDIEKYNLLLIGKAEENQLVGQMQQQLPVEFGKNIVCSDGLQLDGKDRMLGLYYYNPLAPGKLIYWVAADKAEDYHPYNLLMQLQNNTPSGTDLLVVRENPPMLIKIRAFDSRWNWSEAFSNTARIAADENTFGEVFRRVAESIRHASGSDFSLQQIQVPPELQAGMPGLTQWSDFASLYFMTPIAVTQIKGTRLQLYQQNIAERGLRLRFYPPVDSSINPDRNYQIALPATYFEIQQLINLQQIIPDFFTITDLTVFETMRQMLF